jgi:lipopolysaccharide export system permease protein
MLILQRYVRDNLLWVTMLALFGLVSLFAFFTLIDQLEDAGRGNYGIPEAVVYTVLTMPRLAYELFPVAAVIGGMAMLGIMARNSELDIIYTSGVSRMRFALMLARSSVLLVVLAVAIGELVAPASEERAQNLRSMSLTEQITLKTRYGFWIRDADSYVNIRKVLPGNRIEEIYFYQFDDRQNLRSSIHAGSAVYVNGQWDMQDITESVISEEAVTRRALQRARWDSLLDPEIINVVTVKPQYLTLPGLTNYIRYLRQNAQNTMLYEQALWAKLVKPFSIIAMLMLAVPLVHGQARSAAVGQRVFMGTLAGLVFHLCNQVSANLGIVYQIHPAISVVAPTVLLYLLIISLLRN